MQSELELVCKLLFLHGHFAFVIHVNYSSLDAFIVKLSLQSCNCPSVIGPFHMMSHNFRSDAKQGVLTSASLGKRYRYQHGVHPDVCTSAKTMVRG